MLPMELHGDRRFNLRSSHPRFLAPSHVFLPQNLLLNSLIIALDGDGLRNQHVLLGLLHLPRNDEVVVLKFELVVEMAQAGCLLLELVKLFGSF